MKTQRQQIAETIGEAARVRGPDHRLGNDRTAPGLRRPVRRRLGWNDPTNTRDRHPYREEVIRRCRVKVATRSIPPPTEAEIDHGVPVFLDQLMDALRLGQITTEISRSAMGART